MTPQQIAVEIAHGTHGLGDEDRAKVTEHRYFGNEIILTITKSIRAQLMTGHLEEIEKIDAALAALGVTGLEPVP